MRRFAFPPVPLLVLLPLPRRLFILTGDHVRVDFLGRPDRTMAQARGHRLQWHALGQQDRCVGMPEQVERRTLRLGDLQALEEGRHGRRNRIRMQGGAVRVREDQVEAGAVVWPVLPPDFILAPAVRLERGLRRLREDDGPRLLGLRALELQNVMHADLPIRRFNDSECLRKRPGDDGAAVHDVRLSEGQQLAQPAVRGHPLKLQAARCSRANDCSGCVVVPAGNAVTVAYRLRETAIAFKRLPVGAPTTSIVVPVVEGSNPSAHPKRRANVPSASPSVWLTRLVETEARARPLGCARVSLDSIPGLLDELEGPLG